MFRLDGRVALVTGAGQGIGAGIAAVLAEVGASVAVNDISDERARTTAQAIGGVAAPFDVTDLAAVRTGVAALPPIDILVNNAGIPERFAMAPFRDLEPGAWAATVDVNLYGVLNCVKATIDGMCARGWGRVITISSAAGQIGLNSGLAVYAAGKGGATAFMRHLALEVAPCGVTANTLSLGLMDSRSGAPAPEGTERRVPTRRLGTAQDVGAAVVWLAAEGGWVTGQTIGINGGAPTS